MKVGLFTVLYNDRPLEKVLEYISQLGYEAVELACWKGSNHIDIDRVVSGGAGARGFSRDSGVEQAIQFLKPLVKVRPPEVKPWW
jgi:sugar phosphate isomerase/epimerase